MGDPVSAQLHMVFPLTALTFSYTKNTLDYILFYSLAFKVSCVPDYQGPILKF